MKSRPWELCLSYTKHTCVKQAWQNYAKVSPTRKYKYQNRKQTGNLENNFGDVDVEWWLIDNDRV